ncbi:MAG: ABC transporter substrate-binding protein [Alphaproteobacteria bacterium]|nr:ABC transporter substrate-binding protein [Alphaproteobacteria bacterium]
MNGITRRGVLKGMGAAGAVAAASTLPAPYVRAATPIKAGILLPYSGTYSRLGEAITNGFMLNLGKSGDMLGGRPVELVRLDSEAKPPLGPSNATKLINGEKVDVLVGPVHSGVAMGMAKIAREEEALTIIPNAGADQLTGVLCAPNIFRSSFSNWQASYPMGKVLADRGTKRVALIYWNYAAGKQAAQGFKDGFADGDGEIVTEIGVPFPEVEFQAALTQVAEVNPDAVYVFFSGGGAVKFVKDWAAAGLKDKIALHGPGFLTEGVTDAQGEAAEGIETAMHYADTLDNPENKAFRAAYADRFGKNPDVFAVQGYDAGALLRVGVEAVQGDMDARGDLYAALSAADFASPRGRFRLSAAHNPIQDFYLRQVENGVNVVKGIAVAQLADPAKGCKLA